MTDAHASPLGKAVAYATQRDAALLFAIPRAGDRARLGYAEAELPFLGVDIWNAYEFSWLDARGKPRVALAEFRVPAESPSMIESKSFKLYLNSYSQTRVSDTDTLREWLSSDLSAAAGDTVSVQLGTPTAKESLQLQQLEGELIDDLPLAIDHYGPPKPELLYGNPEAVVEEKLVTHVFKSNCPVTGQPDWASLQIRYHGPRFDRAGLLRYLVSFREHADFHEHCVERIFRDIQQRCEPDKLSVYARFTRRGGLDINPFRTTPGWMLPDNTRTVRQ